MVLYKDTITLFNRYITKDRKVIWYPTILHGVNLNIDKASIIAKYGTESQDNAVLNAKYHVSDGAIMVSDKQWLLPKEWKKQIEETLSETLTFTAGTQEFDFFYVGEWQSEEPIADGDYANGFYSYVNKTYDEVFIITSVAKYSVIPHFEVMAK